MGVARRVAGGVAEVEGPAGEIISTVMTWSELSTVYSGLGPGGERTNQMLTNSQLIFFLL